MLNCDDLVKFAEQIEQITNAPQIESQHSTIIRELFSFLLSKAR